MARLSQKQNPPTPNLDLSARGKTRVLFVCGRNQWRSPTAQRIYRNDERIEVRSAGVASSAKRRLSEKDLAWADRVLVMEQKHAAAIRQRFRNLVDLPAIAVLDIPDDFRFMDAELIRLLRERVEDEIGDLIAPGE